MTTQTAIKPGTWKFDQAHSSVEFSVRHMMFATVRGRFTRAEADLTYDRENPANSSVAVRIDVKSVDTNEPARDEHLRTSDFFDAATYPLLTFNSRKVTRKGKDRLDIAGDLTIRGVTREVILDTEITGSGVDPEGNERIGFSARTTVNRKDFGVSWNAALEAGGFLVGDEVKIYIETQAVREAL